MMNKAKAAAFVALMFILGAAQDKTSQAALKDLPLPWVVATLHFGAGMLWVFPAWVSTRHVETWYEKTVACQGFLVSRVSHLLWGTPVGKVPG